MSFNIRKSKLFMGFTPIENMFISEYMPAADGDFVKVYLLAYHFANFEQEHLNFHSLCKFLSLPIERVVEAFEYWQDKGILKIRKKNLSDDIELNISDEINRDNMMDVDIYEYDVEFYFINDIYINNNHSFLFPQSENIKSLSQSSETETDAQYSGIIGTADKIEEAMQNRAFKELIEKIISLQAGKPIEATDVNKIIKFNKENLMSVEIIEKAFVYTFKEKKIKDGAINYAFKVLKNWYNFNVFDLESYEKQKDLLDLYFNPNASSGNPKTAANISNAREQNKPANKPDYRDKKQNKYNPISKTKDYHNRNNQKRTSRITKEETDAIIKRQNENFLEW